MSSGIEHLAWVGTTFRRVGFERLGELVLPPDDAPARQALREALGAEELVWLATCNRVEVHIAHAKPDPEVLRAAMRAFFAARGVDVAEDAFESRTGREALRHLFRVVASLDSLVLGETEIAGQARRGLEQAQKEGLSGPLLDRVHDRAQGCWRAVHGSTALGGLETSIADLALEKIAKHFGPDGPRVSLVIGVGPMSVEAAAALATRPGERVFANRTAARALEMAQQFGGRGISLDELRRAPLPWVDLVFTATSSPDPVFGLADLAPALEARRAAGVERPMIVCDLGIPRDSHPELDPVPGLLVVTLEHMEWLAEVRREQHHAEVTRAEEMVAEEVARWEREERFTRLAAESAQQMLKGRLGHLTQEDREAILRFATGLASRMARQPGQE